MVRSRVAALAICALLVSLSVAGILVLAGRRTGSGTFFRTCKYGTAAEVETMLESEPSLAHTRNTRGDTPLHQAAASGDVAVVRVLVAHGADVDAANRFLWTPLLYAVLHRRLDAAEALLNAGANVNVRARPHDMPLHLAVLNGDLDMVKVLVRAGADVNTSITSDGLATPISLARANKYGAIAAYLRQHGAR